MREASEQSGKRENKSERGIANTITMLKLSGYVVPLCNTYMSRDLRDAFWVLILESIYLGV